MKRATPSCGRVCVGKYDPTTRCIRSVSDFVIVLMHTSASTLGGALSPYVLRNEHDQLLENVWQFSKIYPHVDAQRQSKSRYQPSLLVWQHPAEQHVDPTTREPTAAYWAWRKKGMAAAHAVRYPAGFNRRHKCLHALWSSSSPNPSLKSDDNDDMEKLNYIAARKKIYCGEYARLTREHPEFLKLKRMLDEGKNLLLLEVDGPPTNRGAELGWPYTLLSPTKTMLELDEQIVRALVNDDRMPFGHGYVIGALLLNGEKWITE